MSTDEVDDPPNVGTKVLQGIKIALCCASWESASDPVVPQKEVENERKSSSEDNDTLNPRIIRVSGLPMMFGPKKVEELELDRQWNDARLRAPSKNSSFYKTPNTNETWSAKSLQSNWDVFFQSQSDRTSWGLSQIDEPVMLRSGLSLPIEDPITNNESADWTDWEGTDSVTPQIIRGREDVALECSRGKGEVFLTYICKSGIRYTSLSLDSRMEMVAQWLNQGLSTTLPISDHIYPEQRTFQGTFRKLTILEAFGGSLDAEKEGITTFVGPVDGKMSFQMCICDLKILEKATRDYIVFGAGK